MINLFYFINVYVTIVKGFMHDTETGMCSDNCREISGLELDKNIIDGLLHTAPCPPQWDMSLLFAESLCLNCEERLKILKRCLVEWETELDCENINSCQNCIKCDICKRNDHTGTNEIDETTTAQTVTNNNQNEVYMVIVCVCVTVSVMTAVVIFSIVIWYKRKRSLNGRQIEKKDKVLHVETQVTLLKNDNESVNPIEEKTVDLMMERPKDIETVT